MLQRLKAALAATLFVFTCTGCFKATVADARAGDWEAAPRESRWESYYLWGLVGSNEEDIREICPGGQAVMVRQEAGFAAYLVRVVTLGIYSPRNLVVGCAPMRRTAVVVPAATGTGIR